MKIHRLFILPRCPASVVGMPLTTPALHTNIGSKAEDLQRVNGSNSNAVEDLQRL